MRTPDKIYRKFESQINSLEDLQTSIDELFRKRLSGPQPGLFVYRGVADARFGFHSSLYRRVWWTKAAIAGTRLSVTPLPTEAELDAAESQILIDAHRWGLHDTEQGKRSVLRQLAVLQHNQAPTRLIDVSFNIWVALWFAVEPTWHNGVQEADKDGRLFLVDVSTKLINETTERAWEDADVRPWPHRAEDRETEQPPDFVQFAVDASLTAANKAALAKEHRKALVSTHRKVLADWTRRARAWRPTPQDRRIAAQQGAFLFGGVPNSKKKYPASTANNDWLSVEEVRQCTSLPLRFYKADADHGGAAVGNAVYTWRISATAKPNIRHRLERLTGLTTARIYPDIAGFGSYATPYLVDKAPR